MRKIIILLLLSTVYSQVDSDFISPRDFVDRKPTLPEVVFPNFVENEDINVDHSDTLSIGNLVKGYRIQVMISENQEDLVLAKEKLESDIKEKIYIQFELPNYKLRIGNFSSRKKAELYRTKIVQLGYRSSWIIPTLIELDF